MMTIEKNNFNSDNKDQPTLDYLHLKITQIEQEKIEAEREMKHYQLLISVENALKGGVEWLADSYHNDYDRQISLEKVALYQETYIAAKEKYQRACNSLEFYHSMIRSYDYNGLD